VSVISPADVTALVDTDLDSTELQAVIDREEAELASIIGPLTGNRTELFLITTAQRSSRLTLRRTTDAVTVTDNGSAVAEADIRLLADQRSIMRYITATGDPYIRGDWFGPVEVTYEPNDLSHIERVLIELVSLGISAPSANGELASETIGSYAYTRARTATAALTPEQRRRSLIAGLLPRPTATSVRLHSSVISQRELLGTVRPV